MTSFQQIQYEFIAHIKDPKANPYGGEVDDERLKVYRELFFNNVLGFLSSGFPVLESLYSEDNWKKLARHFFAQHECRSPYFIDISKEFVEFLSNEYQMGADDPIFIKELAHYEWLELDVSVRRSQQYAQVWDGKTDVTNFYLSELASLVSYPYPVHQIGPDFQPSASSETVYLVVYRDNADEVNFTLVNAVSAHMLSIIQQQDSIELGELIEHMTQALPQLEPQQVIDSLQQILAQFLKQQILLVV